MRIAFLHYHLKTGGVTTVLKGQIAAVRDDCEVLVLTGDRAGSAWPCQVVQIPALAYDRPGAPLPAPETVADSVLEAVCAVWPEGCDLLHVHNPLLAKNLRFLAIIKRLQRSGVNLFLQVHDFAEDGRPEAYFREPYPSDCHYGVINDRDGDLLIRAGLDPAGLHRLPNVVYPLRLRTPCEPRPLVLYPVRAIRRKNIGEAILLSLFMKNGRRIALTQPPNSARDRASYARWRAFVAEKRLAVDFEAGRHHGFADLVGAADYVLTTSISEGFGLSFLEPWTAGRRVWGRRIDDVCRDFEANGLRLDDMYDRLEVPLAFFDAPAFDRAWRACVAQAAAAFGRSVDGDALERAWSTMTRTGGVDFGLLSERFQRQVIARLLSDPAAARRIVDINPLLADPGPAPAATERIEVNRRVVEGRYGMEGYRRKLLAVYRQVVDRPVRHDLDKKILFESFFDLSRFSLLKWCTDAG